MSLEQIIAENTRAQIDLAQVIRDFLQKFDGSITGKPESATGKPQAEAAKKSEPPASTETPSSKPTTRTSTASSKPSAPAASEPAGGAAPTHTYDEVKAIVLKVSKESGGTPQESREQAEALLARFGVQKISALPADSYDQVHALATKILAGEADATASDVHANELE